ncbi:MAG: hemolysin family protein [Caldilineaceae bacterium]|nr:hemolysin family protein [Caldilineaceae bacterium]HRJ41639.1 hemolysin family protein [Caldilineaceae bacterium]
MEVLIVIAVVVILITLNGIFVAAEIGTIGARRARISQAASEGDRMAQLLLPVLEDPRLLDNYIAACQLGITLSSLILGFYGQAAITPLIEPWLGSLGFVSQAAAVSIAATGVLITLTVIQVALSELAPKSVGIQYPEQTALFMILPVRWAMVAMRPLIWFFNGSGRLFLRLLGMPSVSEGVHIHAPEEILMLVQESGRGGLLDGAEKRLLENTLQLRQRPVRRVMVPRTQLLAASVDAPCAELLSTLAASTYSRMPLYSGSVDNIVGIVHLKDLLCLHLRCEEGADVREIMRVPPYVPDSVPVEDVFGMLQKGHFHMAVVIDEYGGTAGIVAFEDLIEEIFGEIQDEFDREDDEVRISTDERILLDGDTSLERLGQILGLEFPSDDVDTIGGMIVARLGKMPALGDEVEIHRTIFRVEEVNGYAISQISLHVSSEQMESIEEALK